MSLSLVQSNNEFACFGAKVYKFRLCSCLFYVTHYAIRKLESINDLWQFYEEKCSFGLGKNLFWKKNLFWNYHDDCYIGCCRAYTDWAILTSDGNLYEEG